MSDFSEVEHGFALLKNYFHENDKSNRNKFYSALGSCADNCGEEAIKQFDQWWDRTHTTTFISCFSEHTAADDAHGRLSMWRAFGKHEAPVAIVLKGLPLEGNPPLGVFFSPVAYFSQSELDREFDALVQNIVENADFLKTFSREQLVNITFLTLVFAVVSLKHSAFREEAEWRLVHLPVPPMTSARVVKSIEVIRGIPQVVRKVRLKNDPTAQIEGIEIRELLDRVIIGPTQYGLSIYDALVAELSAAGVSEAHSKVFVSGIPLRV